MHLQYNLKKQMQNSNKLKDDTFEKPAHKFNSRCG